MLEVFSGSGILSHIARKRGHNSITVDKYTSSDIEEDILEFGYERFKRGQFDYIHFSPVCKYYSMASISHHQEKINNTFYPKTKKAYKGFLQLLKCWEILMYLKPKYWTIENPKATMHKLPYMNNEYKKEVWYCRYGDTSAKPTNIWTNIPIEFDKCSNGNPFCHHERAPRGSKSGTQGKKGNYERSKLPLKLCIYIIKTIEKELKNDQNEKMSKDIGDKNEKVEK